EPRVAEPIDDLAVEEKAVGRHRDLSTGRRAAHNIVDSRMKERLAAEQSDVRGAKPVDGCNSRSQDVVRHLRRMLVVLRAISAAQVAAPRDHELDFDRRASSNDVEGSAK